MSTNVGDTVQNYDQNHQGYNYFVKHDNKYALWNKAQAISKGTAPTTSPKPPPNFPFGQGEGKDINPIYDEINYIFKTSKTAYLLIKSVSPYYTYSFFN